MTDPHDRAHGNTCMSACRSLDSGRPWVDATVADSKGCGANMRVAPVGLLGGEWFDGDPVAGRSGVAQFQAALTHGHPTALAASELTAEAVRFLADGGEPGELRRHLRGYAAIQRAAVSSGDSESIACLAGAFAGARHGLSAWSAAWVENCECAERLRAAAAGLSDR